MDEKEYNIKSITAELNKNTMFHLSLGSKELFHSNFLEFLWKQDKKAFLFMLNSLLPEDKRIDIQSLLEAKSLTLEREKEHFDICIYHKRGNSIIYDFILENKVKSIPYKEQLDKYKGNITNKIGNRKKEELRKKPIYILLSLSTKFVQRSDIEDSGWYVISYGDLAEHIIPYYRGVNSVYIHDYIELIRNLNKLEEFISIDQNEGCIRKYWKEIRMYDLYCKLSGSLCVEYLYKNLKIPGYVIKICGETKRTRNVDEPTIFLDSAIVNSKETILTASIINPKSRKGIIYEIQIEGKEYKHMYNKKDIIAGIDKKDSVDQVIRNMKDYFSCKFIECSNIEGISGDVKYGKYRPDVVYGHMDMGSFLSEGKLELMCKDIQKFCEQLSKIK